MQISISNVIGRAISLGSYASKLIKAFKARVLSYPTSIFEAEACLDATLTELNAIGLLKEASLVITPNAYNEGILYDVVPNTTLGDMNVVRATTTATRVNSAGLIEVVPRNLLTYSERFENAAWLAGGSGAFVVTTNSTTAPNGTLTADKLIAPLTNQTIRQNLATINTSFTLSVYLKTNSGTKQMRLFINDTGIQLTVNVTSDWQRFTLSGTTGGTLLGSGRVGFSNIDILNESSFVYAWGAQLELGSLTEYFPTTTRLNIPRIDYTNGSCPSILVEPQRTNLLLQSNNFTASWVIGSNVTVTSNYAISPDGNTNASRLATSGASQNVYQTGIATIIGSVYTVSIYAKNTIAGTNQKLKFGSFTVGFSQYTLTDNWKRYTHTYTANTTSELIGITSPTPVVNFDILTYQFQIELGSYVTSVIPTIASTVTRNADVISKTGISSLIGQTEGTIFLEADIQKRNASDFYIAISNGFSLAESIYLNQPSSGNLNVLFRTGVLTPTIVVLSANWNIGNNKIAIAYNSTLGEVFINGVSKGTIALTAIPTCNQIALGSRPDSPGGLVGAGPYKQAILFKTRLTNTELQSLTTL